MKLDFFENPTSGNLMCVTTEGVIVAKKGMSVDAITSALENGDARVVEGEYQGKPSKSILVGFGREAVLSVDLKKLQARKSSPAVAVEITYLD